MTSIMTEKLTADDVDRLIRQARSPDPLIFLPARDKLVELRKNPDRLPNEVSKETIYYVVETLLLPFG